MDFDHLETFLEVARHKSFSRAAERRFRTQPAISSQIRAIEDEVGARLLDRSGGRVALTDAGRIFLKYVEDALEARRGMIADLADSSHVPSGEVIVAANEGTCLHVLPEVFAEFKSRYPDVAITVQRSESREVLETVLASSVDFGVVALPIDDRRLTHIPLHRDKLVLITYKGHPLSKKKVVPFAELAKYPLLIPKVGRTREAIEDFLLERHIKPNVSMALDSSELLKRFVAVGIGIGFIASSNVKDEVRAGSLFVSKVEEMHIRRDLALIYRKERSMSRAAQAFIEIAVKLKNGAASAV
jgi:LysR family transcriptional regulator, low CO2-responsive transcriptional regulator